MRSIVLLLAFLVARPSSVASQLPTWLRPGARLRVTTGTTSPRLIGVLVSSSPDSFVIIADHNADTMRVGLTVASRIEVSRERRTRAGQGGRIGGLLGSGLVLLVIGTSGDEVPPSTAGTVLLCGVFGGLGAGLGGLIGSGLATDVWEPIARESARFQIKPALHGVSIGMSFKL
jgi:hypothetical protein